MNNRIFAELNSTPWLIMPSWLEVITNIASGKDVLSNIPDSFTIEQITQRQEALSNQTGTARQNERLTEQRGDIAILNFHGPIIRFGGMMEISGYTSTQTATSEFKKLEDDPSVKTIILHVDGPGGQASSIDQFSNMVSKSSKKTIGYVDSLCASAHYWITSACDEIVASSTSMIGSVGAVYSLVDDTKKMESEGLQKIEIVSGVSPKKRPDITTEEGQAQIKKWADNLGEKFVQAVATNRNISVETVKDKFGQGDLLISDEALKVGMIDKIQDFEDLMSELKTNKPHTTNTKTKGVSMTIEELQAQHPDAYNTIFAAGATAEAERIKSIEAAIPAGYENVASLKDLKFDGKSDARDVKIALFDHDQEQKAKISSDIHSDAGSLNTQVQEISDSQDEQGVDEDKKVEASLDAAIAKQNEGR